MQHAAAPLNVAAVKQHYAIHVLPPRLYARIVKDGAARESSSRHAYKMRASARAMRQRTGARHTPPPRRVSARLFTPCHYALVTMTLLQRAACPLSLLS